MDKIDWCIFITTVLLFFSVTGMWLIYFPLTWWIIILILIPTGGSTTYYIRRRYSDGPKEQITIEEVEPMLTNTNLYF
ncbi:MAG: hypothetical protein CMC93_05455 [Flavobacteriaceae bacterium]|nr:hypothetical protein [Flavobacteriaceae bacterium]|tara:strand:- start:1964 stop:2197 length:234 start_codon:yes stop_codon:yes gene_type:complete